jgi:hypothetical protein
VDGDPPATIKVMIAKNLTGHNRRLGAGENRWITLLRRPARSAGTDGPPLGCAHPVWTGLRRCTGHALVIDRFSPVGRRSIGGQKGKSTAASPGPSGRSDLVMSLALEARREARVARDAGAGNPLSTGWFARWVRGWSRLVEAQPLDGRGCSRTDRGDKNVRQREERKGDVCTFSRQVPGFTSSFLTALTTIRNCNPASLTWLCA